jgi:hypothetical protein
MQFLQDTLQICDAAWLTADLEDAWTQRGLSAFGLQFAGSGRR